MKPTDLWFQVSVGRKILSPLGGLRSLEASSWSLWKHIAIVQEINGEI